MQDDLITPMLEIAVEVMDAGETLPELRARLLRFLEDSPPSGMEIDDEGADWLSCQMSRALWSAMPNPARGFAIERLPAPGRNDRCVIGRDCKHKQCCGSMPSMPPLETGMCWEILCETLPPKRISDILASGKLPDGLLAIVAGRLIAVDPKRVRALLEPHFAGALDARNKHLGDLLMVLCDAYDALEKPKLKRALLERVAADGKGQVRADALQRLATMHSDRGEYPLAWQRFAEAQRLAPDDPSLAHLEIVMLVGEGRHAEARERARFWSGRFERAGHDNDSMPILDWLRKLARGDDPGRAIAEMAGPGLDQWERRFLAVVESALALPIGTGQLKLEPVGAAEPGAPVNDTELERSVIDRLVAMGVPRQAAREQALKVVADFKAQVATAPPPNAAQTDLFEEAETPEYVIAAGESMQALEEQWHRAWPLGKPFSTNPLPQTVVGVWETPRVEFWIEFLATFPTAFDSPDILDDVLIAIALMPSDGAVWAAQAVREKLLRRAAGLLTPLLTGDFLVPWVYDQNRPALRLMVAQAFDHQDRGDDKALPLLRQLLHLNPNDNHGLRDLVVNELLTRGQDADVLTLIARYHDDIMPSISFGRVLAHFRLGHLGEAKQALADALKYCPKIPAWLLPARKAEPKGRSEYGIQVGGDEEAWNYREDMREVWAGSNGALEWLKREAGNV